MAVLTSSETNEWYTPPEIIDLVREVIGPITLDPASHPIPQQWIRATRYFTQKDDGLLYHWNDVAIFLNPPYGKTGQRSNQEIWMKHMINSLPGITACIALTKTTPGYNWWDSLFNWTWPGSVCITRGRLSFVRHDGTRGGHSKAASSFWYFGPKPQVFRAVFRRIGRVIDR